MLPSIISSTQTAFVEGQHILNNLFTSWEGIGVPLQHAPKPLLWGTLTTSFVMQIGFVEGQHILDNLITSCEGIVVPLQQYP